MSATNNVVFFIGHAYQSHLLMSSAGITVHAHSKELYVHICSMQSKHMCSMSSNFPLAGVYRSCLFSIILEAKSINKDHFDSVSVNKYHHLYLGV